MKDSRKAFEEWSLDWVRNNGEVVPAPLTIWQASEQRIVELLESEAIRISKAIQDQAEYSLGKAERNADFEKHKVYWIDVGKAAISAIKQIIKEGV